MKDAMGIAGKVRIEIFDKDGNRKYDETVHNLITAVGDQFYAARGAGVASPPAAVTGMRLGIGSTAASKTGAGAAIVTKLTDGNQALDATPTATGGVVQYKCTYGPGKATSASAITEIVLVNDTIATDQATAAANTIARALVPGVAQKQAGDTLVATWTHTLLGA